VASDGKVVISTKLDNTDLKKDLGEVKGSLGGLKTVMRSTAKDVQAAFVKGFEKPVERARARVNELQRQLDTVTIALKDAMKADNDAAAEKYGRQQINIYDKLEAAREKLAIEIKAAAKKQADAEEKEAKKGEEALRKSFNSAGKEAKRFGTRLRSIVSGALVFNLISSGLRNFTSYLGKTLKTNKGFSEELAKLKAALLTAFQPIYNYVLPILTKVVRYLAVAAQMVAEFFSSLTGTTLQDSANAAEKLYEEADAIGSVGKAAKDAKKSLAGFDEINTLQNQSDESTILPDFSSLKDTAVSEELEKTKEKVKEILDYAALIAAAYGGLKLGSFLSDLITADTTASSLKKTIQKLAKKAGFTVGVALAVTGITLEIEGIVDTVANGLDEDSLLEILGGSAAITAGGAMIGKTFGNSLLGGAVGAIVAGIPGYITGIYDAAKDGLDWMNASLIAVSTTMAGAGIGALFGSIVGPIGMGIGGAIGLATGLITDGILLMVKEAKEESITFLTEAEKELIERASKTAEAFREQQDQTRKNIEATLVEMDYISDLVGELDNLVDASGRVKDADEGRVKFILGQLTDAFGVEYELVDGVIQGYDRLKSSIDGTIKSKLADMLLEESKGDVLDAIHAKAEAWESVQLAQKEYAGMLDLVKEKEKEYESELALYNERVASGYYDIYHMEKSDHEIALQDLKNDLEDLRWDAEESKKLLDASMAEYDNYVNTIIDYENAQAAALSGNYQAAIDILAGKNSLYSQHADTVKESTEATSAALEQEAYDAYLKAKEAVDNFNAGIEGFGKEAVEKAIEAYDKAFAAWQNVDADAQYLGENFGEGFAKGIESTEDRVITASGRLTRAGLNTIREVAVIKSPSHITAEDGAFMGKGLINGLESMTQKLIQAAKNQVNKLLDVYSGINLFGGVGLISNPWKVTAPRIPHLAQGAVIPPNREFLAVLGDQRQGTNIEAPLATIQEAVSLVMQDQTNAILTGFEASIGVQREILEAVLGIQIGDDVIGSAMARYNQKQAVIRGGMV